MRFWLSGHKLGSIGLVGFCLVGLLHAEPSTPETPGRLEPGEGKTPVEVSKKSPTNRPTTAPSHDEILRQMAGELNFSKFDSRLDVVLHWFGLRTALENDGITFKGNLTADYAKNLTGGINTAGDVFHHLLDLRFTFDTRALTGWRDGTFSIDFQNQNGRNGSDRLVGDIQRFDNTDADGRTEISELWFQQLLFDQMLRIKVGKVDANTEFESVQGAAGFLNSSFGFSPTIFLMPTYPDPAMSVNLFVNPAPWIYGSAGVYDGSGATGVNTGSYGPKHFFNGSGDYFYIAEIGARWAPKNQTLPGRVAVGGWYDSADLARFDGGTAAGTSGFYAIAEQTLWHQKYDQPTDPIGIAAFLQYGYADSHVSAVWQHVGGGFTWTGPLVANGRQDDSLGVGFSYAGLSSSGTAGFTKDYELSIESFYGIQVKPYLVVKPDIQYIINPGGGAARNALATSVRVIFAF